jgi:hypothetical protein
MFFVFIVHVCSGKNHMFYVLFITYVFFRFRLWFRQYIAVPKGFHMQNNLGNADIPQVCLYALAFLVRTVALITTILKTRALLDMPKSKGRLITTFQKSSM